MKVWRVAKTQYLFGNRGEVSVCYGLDGCSLVVVYVKLCMRKQFNVGTTALYVQCKQPGGEEYGNK